VAAPLTPLERVGSLWVRTSFQHGTSANKIVPLTCVDQAQASPSHRPIGQNEIPTGGRCMCSIVVLIRFIFFASFVVVEVECTSWIGFVCGENPLRVTSRRLCCTFLPIAAGVIVNVGFPACHSQSYIVVADFFVPVWTSVQCVPHVFPQSVCVVGTGRIVSESSQIPGSVPRCSLNQLEEIACRQEPAAATEELCPHTAVCFVDTQITVTVTHTTARCKRQRPVYNSSIPHVIFKFLSRTVLPPGSS
jgi:hypothetical protein